MRATVAVLLLSISLLAGCSGSPSGEPKAGDFEDLNVQATSTTGILLGVVVDEAIRPLKDVDVTVSTPAGNELKGKTDAQGRFAFSGLQPGTHLIRATHPSYSPVQSSAEVVAGVEDPAVIRVQMQRLFSQDPYSELIKFDGFLSCSYSFPVGSTCVNDYTRLIAFVPGCEGGCLKDYNVSKQGGNTREYTTYVGPGWQVIVMEATWEPTSQTSTGLTMSVSYLNRTSTGHFFGNVQGPNPLRIEFDVGKSAPGQQEEPELIPAEGMNNLFVFYNDGGGPGSVTVNQPFTHFQSNFYFGLPPDGWSFVRGDPMPF